MQALAFLFILNCSPFLDCKSGLGRIRLFCL